jgi:hypothetical protein
LAIVAGSLKIAFTGRRSGIILMAAGLFITLHLAYGAGLWGGAISSLRRALTRSPHLPRTRVLEEFVAGDRIFLTE